jgi:hypothetical protein
MKEKVWVVHQDHYDKDEIREKLRPVVSENAALFREKRICQTESFDRPSARRPCHHPPDVLRGQSSFWKNWAALLPGGTALGPLRRIAPFHVYKACGIERALAGQKRKLNFDLSVKKVRGSFPNEGDSHSGPAFKRGRHRGYR